ncbi:MAG TPA: hypothetical protein VKA85_10645 [Candidatus Limnocylindrales bacterium]|nr:hypothetical protein [Candidatus Limnocylindrales bacterium]
MTRDDRPIPKRRWIAASVAGLLVAAAAGFVTSSVHLEEAAGVVAALALGSLVAGVVAGATSPGQWAVAAAVTVLGVGLVSVLLSLFIGILFLITPMIDPPRGA